MDDFDTLLEVLRALLLFSEDILFVLGHDFLLGLFLLLLLLFSELVVSPPELDVVVAHGFGSVQVTTLRHHQFLSHLNSI